LTPGWLLIAGGLLTWLLPDRLRAIVSLVLPVASMWQLTEYVPEGLVTQLMLFDSTLSPIRADRLSWIWGAIFHLATLIAALYSVHQRDRLEQSMSLVYAGAAIACVFAGDLLTLFIFWELMAVSSTFLIWARRTERSYRAGMRYLIVQIASGVLLLAGCVFQLNDHGNLSFGDPGQFGVFHDQWGDRASWLLLLAFGIKAAFPLLHMWLPDAYPEASPGGTVFLSTFSSKVAVYTLVRGFAGFEPLIAVGCVMAIAPLLYAAVEDDVRRALAYCLINQLGFMVVAVGVGSELAINGAAAHAVAHIMYKGLLFMATGTVLWCTGTDKASRLGGLAVTMPFTFACYLIGAAAIAAPLFSGFVAKSLTMSAVNRSERQLAWICLMVATSGVVLVCGFRITSDVFLGRETSVPRQNVPWNMRLAMFVSSLGCLLMGLFPGTVYRCLPFAVNYRPYTLPHVVAALQLICFAGLAFLGLSWLRLYPNRAPGRLLDADWLYRRAIPATVAWSGPKAASLVHQCTSRCLSTNNWIWQHVGLRLADDGSRGRFAATGRMAMAAAVMLVIYLLLYYF
jgi:multicomponent Na+:H+ antiporter subunit D